MLLFTLAIRVKFPEMFMFSYIVKYYFLIYKLFLLHFQDININATLSLKQMILYERRMYWSLVPSYPSLSDRCMRYFQDLYCCTSLLTNHSTAIWLKVFRQGRTKKNYCNRMFFRCFFAIGITLKRKFHVACRRKEPKCSVRE